MRQQQQQQQLRKNKSAFLLSVAAAAVAATTTCTYAAPVHTDQADNMFEVIEANFKDISNMSGSVLPSNLQKLNSWDVCPNIIKDGVFEGDMVKKVMDELGYTEYCTYNTSSSNNGDSDTRDATCKAIDAAWKTFSDLEKKFPQGPVFAEHFMVNWGQTRESQKAGRINSCKPGTYSNVIL